MPGRANPETRAVNPTPFPENIRPIPVRPEIQLQIDSLPRNFIKDVVQLESRSPHSS